MTWRPQILRSWGIMRRFGPRDNTPRHFRHVDNLGASPEHDDGSKIEA